MLKLPLVLLTGLTLIATPVMAEPLDMAAMTCDKFTTSKDETIQVLLSWMDGYWRGKHKQKQFDLDAMQKTAAAVAKECVAQGDEKVLDVYGKMRGDN